MECFECFIGSRTLSVMLELVDEWFELATSDSRHICELSYFVSLPRVEERPSGNEEAKSLSTFVSHVRQIAWFWTTIQERSLSRARLLRRDDLNIVVKR